MRPILFESWDTDPFYHRACTLLLQMGVTPRYTGFFQSAYAAAAMVHHPELMLSLSKWLLPQVAQAHHTSWQAVERNIRTVARLAWQQSPELLRTCTDYPLDRQPTCSEFLTVLSLLTHRQRP